MSEYQETQKANKYLGGLNKKVLLAHHFYCSQKSRELNSSTYSTLISYFCLTGRLAPCFRDFQITTRIPLPFDQAVSCVIQFTKYSLLYFGTNIG